MWEFWDDGSPQKEENVEQKTFEQGEQSTYFFW